MMGDRERVGQHSRRDLCVVLEIEPAAECACPLGGFDGDIREIRQHVFNDTCRTDTTIVPRECSCSTDPESTEVIHRTCNIESGCPCTVFGEFDAVPELVDLEDGRIRVETYLSNRKRLAELVDSLKEVSEQLRLRQLKRIHDGDGDRDRCIVTLDLVEITDKQREAVTRAVAAGYYSSPRETSLDELAAEFGISSSALSQRLTAVESKLATAAFTQASADG